MIRPGTLAASALWLVLAIVGARAADEAGLTHLIPSGGQQGKSVEVCFYFATGDTNELLEFDEFSVTVTETATAAHALGVEVSVGVPHASRGVSTAC